jgi:long-chain acyl-CoA synthetase
MRGGREKFSDSYRSATCFGFPFATVPAMSNTSLASRIGAVDWVIRRAMSVHGDNEAIVDGAVRFTYAQWGRKVLGLGAGLRSLGLGDGDIVALSCLNSWRHLTCWLGVPGGGLVLNNLNYRLAPAELAFILNDSRAKAIIVDKTYVALALELKSLCDSLQHLIYASDGVAPDGFVHIDDLCAYEPLAADATEFINDDTLAAISYTGGTTGLPKGVMQSHGNLLSNAKHMQFAYAATPNDSYMHAAPMFHAADASGTFLITWMGAKHVMIPGWDVERFCYEMEREEVTLTLLVPTMINALVNSPGIEHREFTHWRLMAYGASPMPEELQKRAMSVLPCGFTQLYGMTEASPLLTICSAEDHRKGAAKIRGFVERLRSAGAPVIGVETQVRRDDGVTVCEPGEPGEIYARGPNIMLGYLNRPEETAKALVNGWYRSGDVAYADKDGYLYIVDRAKDMIISGGENIYTTEVENALYAHPAVLEVAVFGIPDEAWGEAVHAEVVPKPGAGVTGDDLITHCRSLIGGYKLPRSINVRSEALPKSGAGKILKRDLRAPFWEGKNRAVN